MQSAWRNTQRPLWGGGTRDGDRQRRQERPTWLLTHVCPPSPFAVLQSCTNSDPQSNAKQVLVLEENESLALWSSSVAPVCVGGTRRTQKSRERRKCINLRLSTLHDCPPRKLLGRVLRMCFFSRGPCANLRSQRMSGPLSKAWFVGRPPSRTDQDRYQARAIAQHERAVVTSSPVAVPHTTEVLELGGRALSE